MWGWGRTRPLWNYSVPYWPEQVLNRINPNHIIVEVGIGSSDYDRACETFYQLVGGSVDYGEAHALKCGKYLADHSITLLKSQATNVSDVHLPKDCFRNGIRTIRFILLDIVTVQIQQLNSIN